MSQEDVAVTALSAGIDKLITLAGCLMVIADDAGNDNWHVSGSAVNVYKFDSFIVDPGDIVNLTATESARCCFPGSFQQVGIANLEYPSAGPFPFSSCQQ